MSDSRRIIEGRCPTCEGPLERRDRDGWCVPCGVGWSYRTTGRRSAVVTMTLEPSTVAFDEAVARSSRIVSKNPRVHITRTENR